MGEFQLKIKETIVNNSKQYVFQIENKGIGEIELMWILDNIVRELRKKKEQEFISVFRADHG